MLLQYGPFLEVTLNLRHPPCYSSSFIPCWSPFCLMPHVFLLTFLKSNINFQSLLLPSCRCLILQSLSLSTFIIKVWSHRLMFSVLRGSVNPRCAGTWSYNPLPSLQSLTPLYVTAVLGIASLHQKFIKSNPLLLLCRAWRPFLILQALWWWDRWLVTRLSFFTVQGDLKNSWIIETGDEDLWWRQDGAPSKPVQQMLVHYLLVCRHWAKWYILSLLPSPS